MRRESFYYKDSNIGPGFLDFFCRLDNYAPRNRENLASIPRFLTSISSIEQTPGSFDMKRWMALDVGSRTVGIAVTDPLKLTARPLTTLQRRDLEADVEALRDLMERHRIERLIVGLPLHLSGERSPTLDSIEPLVSRVKKTTSVLVEWMDERLSTKEAEQLMKELGLSQTERRRKRNEFAATLILKWYLEEKTSQQSPAVPG